MVPMMVLFAGITQHTAQGISLLAMIPASTVGAWTHWKRGNIRTSRLPGLVAGVLAGVFVGGSFAHLIPERELRLALYGAPPLYGPPVSAGKTGAGGGLRAERRTGIDLPEQRDLVIVIRPNRDGIISCDIKKGFAMTVQNVKLNEWVKEVAAMCRPDAVVLVRRQPGGV